MIELNIHRMRRFWERLPSHRRYLFSKMTVPAPAGTFVMERLCPGTLYGFPRWAWVNYKPQP